MCSSKPPGPGSREQLTEHGIDDATVTHDHDHSPSMPVDDRGHRCADPEMELGDRLPTGERHGVRIASQSGMP